MSSERRGYEFGKYAKQAIDRNSKKTCVVTGTKIKLERHHLLPIWMAKEYIPEHRRNVIRSGYNGVTLNKKIHQKLHDQMNAWSDSTKANFALGLYSYLEEEYYKGIMPQFVPKEVGHRRLTDNRKEPEVIYAATGD